MCKQGTKSVMQTTRRLWRELAYRLLYILIIYADDIAVIGNEVVEVERLEKHLSAEFELMILVSLRYILGIEIARSQGTREIYVRSIGRNDY